jgi:hypothetical protein
MLTYNWNFNPLTCHTHLEGHEDVVMTVHWQYSAVSASIDTTGPSYSAQNIGTQSFTLDPEQENFIPFEELTKETVQGWIETAMGEDRITQMQESLALQIEDQITPKIVNLPAPWIPTGSI